MEPLNPPSPFRRRFAPPVEAGVGYAFILILLFYRLLSGAVLYPLAIAPSKMDLQLYSNRDQGDVCTMVIPWQFEQYQHRGGIPMWNPYIYCGFPVFANGESELLNPTHWIYYLVNPDLARGPMAALRLWVSAMAMFIFLHRLRLSRFAAFLGGAVWMLSGFNIRWLLWCVADSSLVTPILLLALDAYLDQPSARRWALTALAGVLLGLSGHPGTQVVVGMVAVTFVLLRLAGQRAEGLPWSKAGLRLLACAGAALAAGAGAAAALLPLTRQILESYELANTDRSYPALAAKELWLFLTPNIFGWSRGEHYFTGLINYIEPCCWFGLVALALALTATVSWFLGLRGGGPMSPAQSRDQNGDKGSPRWLATFAVLLFIVSVVLAFGVPIYFAWFHHSAFGRQMRLTRMFLAAHFAGAILAAMGADQFCRAGRSRAWALVILLTLTGLACIYTFGFHPEQLQYLRALSQQPWGLVWIDSSFRVFGGLAVAVIACATTGVIAWKTRGNLSVGPWLRGALTVIVVADLLWVAWDFNPATPLNLTRSPLPPALREAIALAGENRMAGSESILDPNLATIYGFRDPRGYDVPKPYRLGEVLNRLHLETDYRLILPLERLAPVMDAELARWLDRCSVRYLATVAWDQALRISPGTHDRPWPLVRPGRACRVYLNPNADPRAFMPTRAREGSAQDGLHALLDPAIDIRQDTIFEAPPSPAIAPLPGDVAVQGQVRITKDEDEQVALDVVTPTGGLVVLEDNMAPGWIVTVDDAPAAALTTNYLFRGVEVSAGHHLVRWSYQTPGLLAGSFISSLALGALLYLAIRQPRRARSGQAPGQPGGRATAV